MNRHKDADQIFVMGLHRPLAVRSMAASRTAVFVPTHACVGRCVVWSFFLALFSTLHSYVSASHVAFSMCMGFLQPEQLQSLQFDYENFQARFALHLKRQSEAPEEQDDQYVGSAALFLLPFASSLVLWLVSVLLAPPVCSTPRNEASFLYLSVCICIFFLCTCRICPCSSPYAETPSDRLCPRCVLCQAAPRPAPAFQQSMIAPSCISSCGLAKSSSLRTLCVQRWYTSDDRRNITRGLGRQAATVQTGNKVFNIFADDGASSGEQSSSCLHAHVA